MRLRINETFIFQDKVSYLGFGKKITDVEVTPNDNVLELKKRILRRYKLDDHPELFSIIYKGNELLDDRKISDLGLKGNEVLHIICKETSKLNEVLRSKGIL
ncbi:MAG TPA: ubiquitin-like protein [Geobacterales bacterium]|nr:ubiquitin-like protein [Geobacterales bacterium]